MHVTQRWLLCRHDAGLAAAELALHVEKAVLATGAVNS